MTTADARTLIVAQAQAQGVDPGIALAVATRESGINPNIGDGGAGEIGIFQILPSTAPGVNLRDPATNIQFGISYLAQMYAMFGGSWPLAVAAYNDGPKNVQDYLACIRPLPASTLAYVLFVTSVGLVQSCAVAMNPDTSDSSASSDSSATPTLNPDGSVYVPPVVAPAAADNSGTVLLLGMLGLGVAWWLLGD